MTRSDQPGLPFDAAHGPLLPGYPDAAARERAATDFASNLVVVAGAGTGKTSLLVERVLTAIATGKAEVDELAAITFTERAAGELRTRIARGLDRLRRLARGDAVIDAGLEADRVLLRLRAAGTSAAEIERVCLDAMERLDRATITTIHGFCAALLRTWPLDAGLDPDFDVDTGESEATLCQVAWDELVGRELGPDAEHGDRWSRLLASVPLREVDRLAAQVGSFAVPHELLDTDATPESTRLLVREARDSIATADRVLEQSEALSDVMKERLRKLRDLLALYADSGLAALRDEVARGRIDVEESVSTSGKVSQTEKRLAADAVNEVRRLLRNLLRTDDESVRLAVELLAPFARGFRERFLAQGQVSFDGLLALTRELLRGHPDVRQRAKERFRLVFVDEFQDTDPLQCEIVLFLAEETRSCSADAWSARLEPGRLFVVGDPKQSIYRFRGADHEAYRAAVDRILACGGERLALVTNFRSAAPLLGPVNELFASPEGAWKESQHQPAYVPVHAFRDGGTAGTRVELWTVHDPDAKKPMRAGTRRRAEAVAVADEIERGVREGICRHHDVTILLRAFGGLSDYLRALREREIPFVVDGGRDFLKRPEVTQLLATLRALAQPSDPVALLAHLRSPAGAVSDEEMHRWASEKGAWRWTAEPDAGAFPALARAFRALRELARTTRDLPADLLVHRVLDETAMLPLGGAAFEGAQRVANLEKIAAAVSELARDGRLSLEEVLEALEEERLEEIKTDRPLADDAVDAVRITTVHRMKGLESEWIFVPDLAREDRPPPDIEPRARVATLPGGRPVLAVRLRDLRDSAWTWWERENERHETAEELRVLYVALTRARERLVLLAGRPARGTPQWISALAPWGYGDPSEPPADGVAIAGGRVLHRRIAPGERPRTRRGGAAIEGFAEAVRSWEETVRSANERARPPLVAPSAIAEDVTPMRLRERSSGAVVGRAVGVAIHRTLESWGHASARGRSTITAQASLVAEEMGIDPELVGREAGELFTSFAGSALAARYDEIEVLGRELPMLLRGEAGTSYRGTIDLLYRDRTTGAVVVADFKTDRESDAAVLVERYARQLDVYANAVREALELEQRPRTELWLLRSGDIVPTGAPQ